MNLVEAYRTAAAPSADDPRVNALRVRASAVLYEGMMDVAASVRQSNKVHFRRSSTEQIEDAASTVVTRLITDGPRGTCAGDPTTDEGVQLRLRTCLKNELIDKWRRDCKNEELPAELIDQQQVMGPTVGAECPDDVVKRLDAAAARLQSELVPLVQSSLRSDGALALARDIDERLRMRKGLVTLDELVRTALAANTTTVDAEALRTAKNRFYQRHGRSIKRAKAWIRQAVAGGHMSPELSRDLLEALDELRLRG